MNARILSKAHVNGRVYATAEIRALTRFEREIDSPLRFDDPQQSSEPYRLRDCFLVDGHIAPAASAELIHDNVTAHAHHQRIKAERFGQFGTEGSAKAKQFARSMCKSLHHESEYCPCKTLTPEEIKALYDAG